MLRSLWIMPLLLLLGGTLHSWPPRAVDSPPGAIGQRMVFDHESGCMLLFGGAIYDIELRRYIYWNDIWSLDLEREEWSRLETTNPPSARFSPDLTLDTKRRKIFLFGGRTAGGRTGDTWEYDIATCQWQEIICEQHPPAHSDGAMVYDSVRDCFILFGGYLPNNHISDETWLFDPDSRTWNRCDPDTHLQARYGHNMVYDPVRERIILFGGHWEGRNDRGRVIHGYDNRIWYYEVEADRWIDRNTEPAPAERYWISLAFDQNGDRMILFGGSQENATALGDDWVFLCGQEQWVEIGSRNTPGPMINVPLAVDTESDIALLHGSPERTGSVDGETWILDLSSLQWRMVR